MKHPVRTVSAVLLVALLASATALAASRPDPSVIPKDAPRYTKLQFAPQSNQEEFVPLPEPGDPAAAAPPMAGPVDLSGGKNVARGRAIVLPRGGSFLSPRQRADRQIRQLIRALD